MLEITRLNSAAADFDSALDALLDRAPEADPTVTAAVAEIIATVRAQGDAALIDYSNRFDRREIQHAGEL